MAEIVIFIISAIVSLTLICFALTALYAVISLTVEAFYRIDKLIERNADRLFTLGIDFFTKKKK